MLRIFPAAGGLSPLVLAFGGRRAPHCIVADCLVFPPTRGKDGPICGTPSASALRLFFPQEKLWCGRYKGKVQCRLFRMQLLDA